MEPIIRVRELNKTYHLGSERVHALRDVNLNIYKEEIICILGRSGSGKSTLLHLLAGLEKPTSGTVMLNNINVNRCNNETITKIRQQKMGFIFQNFNLLQHLTALENVALPLAFQGIPAEERNIRASEMLLKVGLENRCNHKPNEMSGGQQQRVSIARAFISTPEVVFADEPTGNLDTQTSKSVLELMIDLAKKSAQTLLLVTHDHSVAEYADRIIRISDGMVVSDEKKNN